VWQKPQNPAGTHTSGENIQFEWTTAAPSGQATLRAHIDAQQGVPGMGGATSAGKAFFDVSWQPPDTTSLGSWGDMKSTRYAVASGSVNGQDHKLVMGYNSADGTRFIMSSNGNYIGQLKMDMPSDRSLKSSIVDRSAGGAAKAGAPDFVGFVDAVHVYTFTFNGSGAGGWASTAHTGFMADEVQAAAAAANIPSGVVTTGKGGAADGVSDRDMVAVLWAAVQQLSQRVAALEGHGHPPK